MKVEDILTRLKRAEEAIASGRYSVTKVDRSTFTVINGDGDVYNVSFSDTGTGVCSCPDFAKRGGPVCKHIALVVRTYFPAHYERWKNKVLALAEDAQAEQTPEQPTNLTIQDPIHSEEDTMNNSFAEILRRLSEPFPPEVIQWKPGAVSKDKTRAMALAYVDSREYMARADEVVPDWSDDYQVMVLPDRVFVICKLTVSGITRTGDGEAPLEDDHGDVGNALTTASAQAFKRAWAKFGLGRDLYSIPRIWVDYDPERKCFTPEGLAKLQAFLKNGSLPEDPEPQAQKNGQAPTQNGQGKPVQVQPAQNGGQKPSHSASQPTSDPEVKFGKYAGKRISQIAAEDPDYVAWLAKEWQWEEGRKAAQAWANHLGILE